MRRAFVEQRVQLEDRILDDLTTATNALMTVSAAVQGGSDRRTVAIGADADKIRADANRVQADLVVVTARQTPVASDLRLVMAMIELAHPSR